MQKNSWVKKTLNSLALLFLLLNSQCSKSSSPGINDQVVSASVAYASWPNSSTTDTNSSQIVSKVLMTDMDNDGTSENVFLSAVPSSTNKRNSVLRVTIGEGFKEVANYQSSRLALFHDSVPYAKDLDGDGEKELVFVSYERDQVYAFELKSKNHKLDMRWQANLPETLPENFDRHFQSVSYKNKTYIKINHFGVREGKNREVSVVDFNDD